MGEIIIKTIDAVDSGQMDKVGINDQVTLSQIISSYNPISFEATPEERDEAFEQAVGFAKDWSFRSDNGRLWRPKQTDNERATVYKTDCFISPTYVG